MQKYAILLKGGSVVTTESRWLEPLAIIDMLNDRQPFIKIGDKVFSKDTIAMIEKIEVTEKEN